jgi:hypothetical protein
MEDLMEMSTGLVASSLAVAAAVASTIWSLNSIDWPTIW